MSRVRTEQPKWTRSDAFDLAALRFRLVLERVQRETNSKRRRKHEARLDDLRKTFHALKAGRAR